MALWGFVMPFAIRAKILMQKVWVSGIDWDDQLPENILDKAKKWFAEFQDLVNTKIGRYLRRSTTQVVADQYFHVFSDPSEDAYAVVMYERNVYEDGSVSVSFIASKTKVTMLGAILGLHLCQVVSKILGDRVIKKSIFWCDSMSVLYWNLSGILSMEEYILLTLGVKKWILLYYLAAAHGGMVQNSCFATKVETTWSSSVLSNYGFSDMSNCSTAGMEMRFQQILQLEKTVKSNLLGQAIH